ncbi:MAG TPA: transcription antitermination factor NusB [Geminicoccaceae bacterium]
MNRRRAARYGAVQALYQLEVGGAAVDLVIGEFHAHRLADLLDPLELEGEAPEVDREWFQTVTRGAWRRSAELDPLIEARLASGWSLDRLGYLVRAVLRAGTFELAERLDVPPRVVINEYVGLAHDFLPREDAGFVNAVLDRLAGELRPDDESVRRAADA